MKSELESKTDGRYVWNPIYGKEYPLGFIGVKYRFFEKNWRGSFL